jgi:hypothetical protein
MSRKSVEVVRSFYEALARNDFPDEVIDPMSST